MLVCTMMMTYHGKLGCWQAGTPAWVHAHTLVVYVCMLICAGLSCFFILFPCDDRGVLSPTCVPCKSARFCGVRVVQCNIGRSPIDCGSCVYTVAYILRRDAGVHRQVTHLSVHMSELASIPVRTSCTRVVEPGLYTCSNIISVQRANTGSAPSYSQYVRQFN